MRYNAGVLCFLRAVAAYCKHAGAENSEMRSPHQLLTGMLYRSRQDHYQRAS